MTSLGSSALLERPRKQAVGLGPPNSMASTGEAAERSLLEAATPSYGTAPAAERPQLSPDELLKELTRNAEVPGCSGFQHV